MSNVIAFPERNLVDRLERLSEGFKLLSERLTRNYVEIRIYEDGQRATYVHADTEEAAERLKGLM